MPDEQVTSKVESTGEQVGTPETDAGFNPENLTTEQFEALIAKIPEDKLATLPGFEKRLQSLKDKEAARIERTYRQRSQDYANQKRREAEEAEFATLEESEDFTEIGQRTVEQRRQARQLQEAASMVSGTIEDMIVERPAFKALGEDTIKEIAASITEKKGTVVDFVDALSAAARDAEVKKATEETRKAFSEELAATLQEYGLTKRSEDSDKGNAPVPGVEQSRGVSSLPRGSDEELLDKYGRGDIDLPPDEVRKMLAKKGIKI